MLHVPSWPVVRYSLPGHVPPPFLQVVSPSFGWSPLLYFLVVWAPIREPFRTCLRSLMCSAQDHFIFPTFVIMSMTFVLPLTQNVGPCAIVRDADHTYFHFGLCGKCVLCLFGECPCIYSIILHVVQNNTHSIPSSSMYNGMKPYIARWPCCHFTLSLGCTRCCCPSAL